MPEKLATPLRSVGLLVLRVVAGGMMVGGHGWGKLANFAQKAETFADPLGVGSTLSLTLAVSAEVFCSALVVLGLATRAAAVPVVITMLVAATIIHADDPWSKKEFALMYGLPFLVLIFTGAGDYSLDALIAKFRRGRKS